MNHRIIKIRTFDGAPLEGYIASKLFLDFAPEIKNSIVEIPSDQ